MALFLYLGFLPWYLPGQQLSHKINPDLFDQRWSAQWIQHPTASSSCYGVFHFRKSFQLDEVPAEFIVQVSADNRYRLFVNGKPVCFGPARGDALHWYYESVDIAGQLKPGDNVLAAEVWNAGSDRPLAQITYQTAFILQGNSNLEAVANTNNTWKVIQNEAYQPLKVDHRMIRGYYAAGATDHVDAAKYPWGWQEQSYEDDEWLSAASISFGGYGVPQRFTRYSAMSAWQLTPRDIPMMEMREERIPNIIRIRGVEVNNDFLTGKGSVTIPSNSSAKILLDLGHLTTAYPELKVSGGEGGELKITYAEALYDESWKKGNRDDTEGKHIFGLYDTYQLDGGRDRLFRPLWYRTYRFVQLEIKTGEDPLQLQEFVGIFTAYPFEEKATFESDLPILDDIWERGWRTARLCAMETYMDCPYYEQLQYVGDTRIQALISLYVSGDDQLMKKSIRQFDQSRFYEGLTMSRHPTYIPQVTPGYSLIFILMVHDYMMYRSDRAFIREMAPGIESVLGWFERNTDETGLLGMLHWVNYMDAAEGFDSGTPPYEHEGHSAQISLLYAYSALHASEIFEYLGEVKKARFYRNIYQSLVKNVRAQCLDASKGLFAETPAKKYFTQHTNILAILTDAIDEGSQVALMEKVLSDPSLTQVEIYFQFYLFEALRKVGLADRYVDMLDDWYDMINQGLSTFAEHRTEARSDCHAWSSHPMHGFLATVCGVRSSQVGFNGVDIEPYLGQLNHVNAAIPHPYGMIEIELNKRKGGALGGFVRLPDGLQGTFGWKGQQLQLKEGENKIDVR